MKAQGWRLLMLRNLFEELTCVIRTEILGSRLHELLEYTTLNNWDLSRI